MLLVALMPPPPTMSKDRGSAFDYSPPFNDTRGMRWAFPVELESSSASFTVSLASSRLRYMIAPSPPLPLALEVGTEALAKVAYEKLDYVRSHFGSALAACELANGELAACLRNTDRGIPSYQAFLKKCLTTIAPLPAASIPSHLQDMCFEVDHTRVARHPFEHGTSIPSSRSSPPRPSPPRLPAVPQRNEDIYTEVWLSLVDAKLLDIQECGMPAAATSALPLSMVASRPSSLTYARCLPPAASSTCVGVPVRSSTCVIPRITLRHGTFPLSTPCGQSRKTAKSAICGAMALTC